MMFISPKDKWSAERMKKAWTQTDIILAVIVANIWGATATILLAMTAGWGFIFVASVCALVPTLSLMLASNEELEAGNK